MGLVSTDDWAVITGSEETAQVARLLEMASDAVLANAHSQNILEQTYTDVELGQFEGVYYFPQRPVSAVASVSVAGVVVDPSGYRWTPGGDRRPATLIRQLFGYDTYWSWDPRYGFDIVDSLPAPSVVVTYTAGWESVPGQIVAAIVSMVSQTISNGFGPSMTLERVAGYEGKWEPGQTPDLGISSSTQAVLDQLCGVDAFTSVPMSGPTGYRTMGHLCRDGSW